MSLITNRTIKQQGVIFLILVALIVVGNWGLSWLSGRYVEEDWRETQARLEEKHAQAYRDLLNEQANRDTASAKKLRDPQKALYAATGVREVHFVLVKPAAMDLTEIQDLVQILSADSGQGSLQHVDDFVVAEAARYKVSFDLVPVIHGPFDLPELTTVGDLAFFWARDAFSILKLQDDFDKVRAAYLPQLGQEDLIVYLYFDDFFNQEVDEAYSFYDYKKFRSFALPSAGRAFVDVYDFDPAFAENAVTIATHEMLHLFGATDKYVEVSITPACTASGRGQVSMFYLPQDTADIMCLYIENPQGVFVQGSLFDSQIVINRVTAGEIGWLE